MKQISVFCVAVLAACGSNVEQLKSEKTTLLERVDSNHSNITFSNDITESELMNIITYEYFYNGGGVAAGDFNNDGLIDLYFTGNQVENKLYLNKGNFQFEDITQTSGTEGTKAWSNGVTLVDINADGYLDIYVSNSGWRKGPDECRNELFVNNGDLTFTEEAAKYGIDDPSYSTQSIFFDLDNDGDLDLYVVNRPERTYREGEAYQLKRTKLERAADRLFLNEGDQFKDIGATHGVIQNGLGYGLGVAAGDLNKDGWTDLYVTNDYVEPDYMYYNINGKLAEGGRYATNHMSNFGMGVDIADVNNDGWPDVFVADMAPDDNYRQKTMMKPMNPGQFYWAVTNGFHFQYMFNSLHLNNQNNSFSDVAQLAGIATTDWSWAVLFEDLDNDSNKDLLVTNGFRKEFSNKDFIKEADKKMGEAMDKSLEERKALMQSLIQKLPETRLRNYLFKNNGELDFNDVSAAWGFEATSFSNGAVITDLNNDGFQDMVISNIDEVPYLFQNLGNENKSVKVMLEGPESNPFGIGTKITLYSGENVQYKEVFASRGYQSAMIGATHFGIANDNVDSITVEWSDGKTETITNPEKEITFRFPNARNPNVDRTGNKQVPMFRLATQEMGSEIVHLENPHDDYKKEILLPHKMSQFGPAFCVGDVNGDGREDFYFGAATGRPGRLFAQQPDQTFEAIEQPAFNKDALYEDVGAVFFDVDNDKDLDLYIASGGNEWSPGSRLYGDRLYINERGTFSRSNNIPDRFVSSSVVKPFDIDEDGDLDLFIGSRLKPQRYPTPDQCTILINENGAFTDRTSQYLADQRELGLITDAQWGDLDQDGNPELVVVGEWTPIVVLELEDNQLVNRTQEYGFENLKGWWYSVTLEDLNQDGREDIVAGNLGLNYKYKASEDEPFHIFYNDFDQNGSGDIVLGYHDDNGELYPLRGRQCASDQMPEIAQRFETYDEYGSADIETVFGADNLSESLHLVATTFASKVLYNKEDGFEVVDLPRMTQVSSINDIIVDDFNEDEVPDILYAGNLYPVEIETTRNDASFGGLLLGSLNGKFNYVGASTTGFNAGGDVKQLGKIKLSNGKTGILVVRNAGRLDLFTINGAENSEVVKK